MVYVTANDSKFFKDYVNLYFTRKFDPGVPEVRLYVIVACLQRNSWFQQWMLHRIMAMVRGSKRIRPMVLVLKNNTGRDFGSVHAGLHVLEPEVQPEDSILIRNRSSWGPQCKGWYKQYLDQLTSNHQMALVGSTIGLNDHPRRKRTEDVAHVQTYVYLSQWKFLSALMPDFPGRYATNHMEAVLHGEIELSQQLMKKGWSISSLQFPGLVIDANNQNQITADQHQKIETDIGLPILKDNQTRNTWYYLKILVILTTVLLYVLPRRRSYKTILLSNQE